MRFNEPLCPTIIDDAMNHIISHVRTDFMVEQDILHWAIKAPTNTWIFVMDTHNIVTNTHLSQVGRVLF